MKCNICDRDLPEPKFNAEVKGKFDPCDTCMEVVQDTLDSWNDKPAAAEDELGQELPLEAYLADPGPAIFHSD